MSQNVFLRLFWFLSSFKHVKKIVFIFLRIIPTSFFMDCAVDVEDVE